MSVPHCRFNSCPVCLDSLFDAPLVAQRCSEPTPSIAFVVRLIEVDLKLPHPIFDSANAKVLQRQSEPKP